MMWDHIYESPIKLQELLINDQITNFVRQYDVKSLNRIIFVASGSSLNIAITAKKLFEQLAQIDVKLVTPFEFMSTNGGVTGQHTETTLVVAISQTGTSSGTVNSINHAKNLGFNVLSITERRDTPAEKLGDYYLNFLSGLEPCNAKTKGVINSLTILILLAVNIAKEKALITDEDYRAYIEEIKTAIEEIPVVIEKTKNWVENHKSWSKVPHFIVIGNGINYGTALEGTLKILETLCVPGVVSELGEFSHGIHRTVNKQSNVIIIHTEEYGHDIAKQTIDYLKERVDNLLVVNATKTSKEDSSYINVKHRPLTSSCLTLHVVFQVLATALPELNGDDPNRPMNNELTERVGTRV